MNRWTVFATILVVAFIAISCTGSADNPVAPDSGTELSANVEQTSNGSATYLWGYYDVTIDLATQQVTAVPDRTTTFAANVVNILNGNPAAMVFTMNLLDIGIDKVVVDIDVELSHPFDGMPQFNGYDVRGVFMGDGSDTMAYDSDLDYAVYGTDQYMMDDPVNADGGGPDGFTRWFNAQEFTTPGMGGYTEGLFATSGFSPSATLNPYKYYADGISISDDPFEFLVANAAGNGEFTSGSSSERNYYLEFPLPTPAATYGYAVVANWEDAAIHPSNAPESPAISVTVTDNIYYVDGSDNGGDLILDLDIWGWNAQPTDIFIESDVLSAVYQFNSVDMAGTVGGSNWSTYHVEITADSVGYNSIATGDSFFWVICEVGGNNYSSIIGAGPADTLAAFFGYSLFIADESYCQDWVPEIDDINGEEPYVVIADTYTDWVMTGEWYEEGNPAIDILDGASLIVSGTNVQYVDQQHLNFDLDLSAVPYGTYDVRVTNGCGAQLTWTEDDMLTVLDLIEVVGTPNINIGSGNPADIAIDPTSDRVAIGYESFWRRWVNDYASNTQYNSWSSLPIKTMDANTGYLFYAHTYPGYSGNICWTWTNWNGSIYGSYWNPSNHGMKDVSNLQGSNEIWGIFDQNGSNRARWMRNLAIYNYYTYYTSSPWYNGSGTTGVVLANLLGVDFAQYTGGNYRMYFLEALPATDTAVVELYRINFGVCTYQNVSFGEDFLYDALDITVDSSYNIYILEENSDGDPVIWAYDSNGDLIGTTGPLSATEISGTPMKIDCHVFKDPDEVHVLHSNGVTRFAM